ncbi:PD-(D/E)XK nuclease domain-containing protein, partial [uncultured Phocaeicola sp.]|uniref:PD-(D/E)XK nuclease domain-containing protein n=2 Tax=uncultured Phocaeicola sp. TaxID=990718 RepID=UPI0025AD5BD5
SSIEGERNIQGFFTAYLSINAYYLTMPEVELNHGFCDMFLMPDLQRYPEVEHSYILELKYLPKDKFEAQSAEQWDAAVQQIHRYAEGEKVRQLCRGTQLHCIVMQFCGWELERMEEV